MYFQIKDYNKLIFFTLIFLLQVHKVYSVDIAPGFQMVNANIIVSKYNEFGLLGSEDTRLHPTIFIDFFGKSSLEPGFNVNLQAVWEEINLTKQQIRYKYTETQSVWNFDEGKREIISSEEKEFDELLDVGTNISGSYLYFFAPITYEILSKDGTKAFSIGYGPALLFLNLSGSAYLTDPCVQDLYDSNPDDFVSSLLKTNCRKVSIETSDIQDIGFAYYFRWIENNITAALKIIEYELIDKKENKLDLTAISLSVSFSF